MTKNQVEAIKQLEAALQLCKRAGLVLVGIDTDLHVTVADKSFKDECRSSSACEAVLDRLNDYHNGTHTLETHRVYLDSGGA
ncbi:hypothetical protein [Pseudomonas sp. MWU12-2323]|uniref:hypothetical protein n=1 Tax=Pseudomonas sp. MWU12-2323 TaxID=2651296 RepID=UPI00128ADEBC|nr:hypothetical protein [Pseudomonas sp. MWU12-2323]MPQ71473.1 hypothetical protein [Pseudomonas sp. MWU12-2323]